MKKLPALSLLAFVMLVPTGANAHTRCACGVTWVSGKCYGGTGFVDEFFGRGSCTRGGYVCRRCPSYGNDHDYRRHDPHVRDVERYEHRRERIYSYERRRDYHDRDERPGRYGRYERECQPLVTAKGAEANTETGAMSVAKRAWRAWVRSDYGERYQDLDYAKHAEYRCWRSSTNESALGKAGEFFAGAYRKRCQIWAVPCLGERQKLEGDKDDRE